VLATRYCHSDSVGPIGLAYSTVFALRQIENLLLKQKRASGPLHVLVTPARPLAAAAASTHSCTVFRFRLRFAWVRAG
jgi:hypothetical protein